MNERYTRAHPEYHLNVPVYRTVREALEHQNEHAVHINHFQVFSAGRRIPCRTLIAYVRNRCHYWSYADFGKGEVLVQHDAETH